MGCVVALESIGLPLPGESLLIAGAILAGTTHQLDIWEVIASATPGATIGHMVGYGIGGAAGFRLLQRYGHHIGLNERRPAYGRALFSRHGIKVFIPSRFIVLLRTLAALLAGANRMPWVPFAAAKAAGSAGWSVL